MVFLNSLANVTATGYGGANNNLALTLLRRGVNLRTALLDGERASVQIYFGQLYDEHLSHELCAPRRADILAIYTMYESSALPQDWVDKLNRIPDLVLVPSQWCAECFRACGVETPIAVVPLGFNPHDWPMLRKLVVQGKRFTFYWQGFADTHDRKGGNLISAAFDDLISSGDLPKNDVRLVMKSTPLIIKTMTRDASVDIDLPWKRTIIKSLPQCALLELLIEADVSFNPTSGEGFGLIPLEHMATGTPVFAPYATGMKDYLAEGTYFPLATKSMNAIIADPTYEKLGNIDRPYYDDIREKMVWAYEHRDELAVVGQRGAEYVAGNFTYEHSADSLLSALETHCGYDAERSWELTPKPISVTTREILV